MIDDNSDQELDDPIIAEVRAARDAYAKRFNYSIRAMCQDIEKSHAEFERQGVRFITGQPRLAQPRTGTDF